MSRLIIASNRLPVTITRVGGEVQVQPSAGGLATGMRDPHERSGGLWIGWPGEAKLSPAGREALTRQLEALRTVPVWLAADDVKRFYEGYSNGVLWPLFHSLPDQMPLRVPDWDAYERVNEQFADVLAAHHQPGDLVWVHDYQLLLVPRLLRARVPTAQIGFFLHVPFPSSEMFRILPMRERLLDGMLGADLVGFHTAAYMRHFASSVLRILGKSTDVDRVQLEGREVQLGIFPMGIDPARFVSLADDPAVLAEARSLREPGWATLVGVDRLDFTKGIPRRLLAFEALLRAHPELLERVRLIQIAVPSRTNVAAYRRFRQQVDEQVGRINGTFGTSHWTPIHYVYGSVSEPELVALYRAADLMLVTPLRDGMNLVAKEFVAARTDEDGVLVLSELAGAAAELAEAIIVSPYDIDGTAEALHRALTLPESERRTRMRALRTRVLGNDVHRWVRNFLAALEQASARREASAQPLTSAADIQALIERMRTAEHLLLLLDYDGTLMPFASVPELAMPDAPLLALLGALTRRSRTTVHIVSGRLHDTLERWLGALPVGLHAEHGFWSRAVGGDWRARPLPAMDWRARVLDVLQEFAARTPGSLIEEKTASLAWHYRMAEPDFGSVQANELRLHLNEVLSNVPVEILLGEKVIEVRAHGVNKGAVVAPLLASIPPGTLVVAMGDDRTDEDLFAALPPDAVAIHVGHAPSRAATRVASIADARRLLAELLDAPV